MIVNKKSSGFGLLVRQNQTFKGLSLVSGKLRWMCYFIDQTINQDNNKAV